MTDSTLVLILFLMLYSVDAEKVITLSWACPVLADRPGLVAFI